MFSSVISQIKSDFKAAHSEPLSFRDTPDVAKNVRIGCVSRDQRGQSANHIKITSKVQSSRL